MRDCVKYAVVILMLVIFAITSTIGLVNGWDKEIISAIGTSFLALEIVWLFTPLWLAAISSPYILGAAFVTLVLPPEMQPGMRIVVIVLAILLTLPVGRKK